MSDSSEIPSSDASDGGGLWDFLKTRKKWWLTPIVIAVLLLAALTVLGERSSVAPFVYSTPTSD